MSLLPICLIAAAVFALGLRNWRMLGAAVILLANWAINTAVVEWTGETYPWSWFLSVDYLSGVVVLIVAGRPSIWQYIVTASFALECIAHGAFGLTRETPWTDYYYWWTLHDVAWSQFWFLIGWGFYELAARGFGHVRGAPSPVAGVGGHSAANPEP